jgi:hypothetical protein
MSCRWRAGRQPLIHSRYQNGQNIFGLTIAFRPPGSGLESVRCRTALIQRRGSTTVRNTHSAASKMLVRMVPKQPRKAQGAMWGLNDGASPVTLVQECCALVDFGKIGANFFGLCN